MSLTKDEQRAHFGRIEMMQAVRVKSALNLKEASFYTDLAESTLYQMVSKELIPFHKPRGGKIYFLKTDLDAWLTKKVEA